MSDDYINLDLSNIDPPFRRLTKGRHKARIIGCTVEHKAYMKNPTSGGTGAAITWVYETFGNEDFTQNNKKIFQSTPLDGKFASITRAVILSALPDKKENRFTPEEVKGKEVEIELVYNIDKATGEERKYPNVKAVYPLIESGSANVEIPDFDSHDVPF
jgi:hypothetical protein